MSTGRMSGANTTPLGRPSPTMIGSKSSSMLKPSYMTGTESTKWPPEDYDQRDLSEKERERKRKRKSCWGGDEKEKVFIPGLPTVLPNNLNPQQERAYLCAIPTKSSDDHSDTFGGILFKNLLSKQQVLPGKSNLKEFKGLLAENSAKKNGSALSTESSDDHSDTFGGILFKNLLSKQQVLPGKSNLKEFKGLLAENSAKKNGSALSTESSDVSVIRKKTNSLVLDSAKKNGSEVSTESSDVIKKTNSLALDSAKKNGSAISTESSNEQSKKQGDSDDDDSEDNDDEDTDPDMLLHGDDDDDDDEEEEEEEDDDDDDEDDDSNKQSSKKKQSVSGQISSPSKKERSFIKNKTPMKNSDKIKKTPKDKAPKKQEKNIEKSSEKQFVKNMQTQKGAQTPQKNASPSKFEKKDDKDNGDSRTLFVRNLPLDVTATEVNALSNDILNVSFPQAKFKRKRKFQFAFLEFSSQNKAEENYKILQSKKLRGQPIKVDFTRPESKHSNPSDQQKKENLKKLFITSLPIDATIGKVASLFPKAFQINVNTNPFYRCASVNFVTEEDAAEALTESKDFKINGLPLTVSYSVSEDLKNEDEDIPKSHPVYKVCQDLKQLLMCEEDTDVTFQVGDQQFKAHRSILKARSPMFAAECDLNMKEKATGMVVDAKDCEPSSFPVFLEFLYCGSTEKLSVENVFSLYTSAHTYNVLDLKIKCLEFIKNNLSVETFCETVKLGLQHSETNLLNLTREFFAGNFKKIILTVKWQNFNVENPLIVNELLIKALASDVQND